MGKRAGIMLGCFILGLFVLVDASDTSLTNTTVGSLSAENVRFLTGYYWDGYLDQREKIKGSSEEGKYRKALSINQLTDLLQA